MKELGLKGLVVITSVANTIVIAVIALAIFGLHATGILSAIGFDNGDSHSLSILMDEATEGTIINSYSDDDTGSVVTMVEINAAMSRIGEIATVSYDYSGVSFSSDSRQIMDWNVPLTRNMVAVEYTGTIKAGYLISDVAFEIDNDTHTIIVTLPELEIISNEIETDDVEWEDNVLNHISPDTVTNLLEEAREEELEAAYSAGIRLEAEENAESIIREVLSKISDYEIVFCSERTALQGVR